MDLCSERLTLIPSSGKIARSSGEYQPISPGCAGIGKAPHSYAASASASYKTRDTPIRSSCRHSSGDPKGEPTSAYSHQSQSGSRAPFMAKSGLSLTRRLDGHVRLWSTAVPWAADRVGTRHSDAECLEV